MDKYNFNALLPNWCWDSDMWHCSSLKMENGQGLPSMCHWCCGEWLDETLHLSLRINNLNKALIWRGVCLITNFSDLPKIDAFWIQTRNAIGHLSISPVGKTFLEIFFSAVSSTAFPSQIGKSTTWVCLHKLFLGLLKCPELWTLWEVCFFPIKSDSWHRIQKHKDVYGINGMLGSLDVSKIK